MNKIHTINTKLKHVKKIFHCADIHIRLYKRHEEYEQVFENLYADFKKRDVTETVIVVAGDLLHAKTDMSPEMIRVASEFLRNLSSIAPTIVIAGNHDLSISNPNRLDSISPLIENLKLPDLYYFKDSGIYNFADVQFAVHSLIGSSDEWPLVTDLDPKKRKIALFHGPVNTAKTDIGYSVTNRLTVDVFDGYDMVLLGDIHKTQILQEHDINKPEIAYAGSLCQQNHGESLSGHGYLIWDVLQSKISEFVEISNSYGYFTLTLKDTSMPDISNIPENVRLRLFVGDVDASDIKKVLTLIRKDRTVLETSINKIPNTKQISNGATTNALDDINDLVQQNTHIKKYIESHFPGVEDNIIDKIIDINTKLNAKIGDDELPKNISWRPIKLKFDNLFSYGSGNEINFETMSGLYGVFSPNATGKTSAFDALCFALYDKTPRAFKGSNIMNTRCDSFFCELEIEIEKIHYVIERTGNRKKNGEVKVDVDFWKLDNGVRVSLNGDDRRDTNSAIRSYVGTYEDFILTTLSVQGQNSLFIETGQSDRKDLLSQFIGLTIFDRLFNLGTDEIRDIAGVLKSFKRDDFTQTLVDTQNKLTLLETEYQHKTCEITEYNNQLVEIVDKIKHLYGMLTPNVKLIDPEPIVSEMKELEESSIALNDIFEKLKTERYTARKNRDDIKYADLTVIRKEYQTFLNAKDALQKLNHKMSLYKVDLKNKQSHLQKLNVHEYDPNCKYCMNNVFVKDSIALKIEHTKLLESISKLDNDIHLGEEFLKSKQSLADDYKLAEEKQQKYFEYDAIYQRAEKEFQNKQLLITNIDSKISQLKDALKNYEVNRGIIEENRLIQNDIDELEISKKKIEQKSSGLDSDILKLHGQLEVLKKTKDEILNNIKEAEEYEASYEAYEVYLSTIGRDGLPYELISQIIPNLEIEVNDILEQIVDFRISMSVDGKNINGKIVYEDDRTWPLELASGMEKFITGLSIRVALMSVSNLPKSSFLVIDEGLGVLDPDNLSSMSELFSILKNKFEFVILISHLDVARDITDKLIEIRRDNNFSYITVK